MSTLTTSQTLTRPQTGRRAMIGFVLALVVTACVVALIAFGGSGSSSSHAKSSAVPAAQLRQYIGNHGDPRTAPAQSLPSGYEPQTSRQRP